MPQLVESIGNDRDMFSSLKPQWTGNVSSLDHWGDHFQPSMAHGLPGEHGGFKWVNGTFQIFPVPSGNPTYKKHIFPSTISYMDGFKQLPLLCFIKKGLCVLHHYFYLTSETILLTWPQTSKIMSQQSTWDRMTSVKNVMVSFVGFFFYFTREQRFLLDFVTFVMAACRLFRLKYVGVVIEWQSVDVHCWCKPFTADRTGWRMTNDLTFDG